MGDFFNKMVIGLKRIPKRGVMEQMRKDYNKAQATLTTEPPVTPERQAVLDRMAKMREAKKRV
ncbi:hypothetical protein LCGC14_1574550 [marine sediment metagenome]|uniref:Uncharacterized protein n=1 Tax=marine sediment metagenome TaxID=412755 RepID=A0A0F9LJ08_9ZZZZ